MGSMLVRPGLSDRTAGGLRAPGAPNLHAYRARLALPEITNHEPQRPATGSNARPRGAMRDHRPHRWISGFGHLRVKLPLARPAPHQVAGKHDTDADRADD